MGPALGFGWASFAQASPDGYEYVYLRDSRTAYGRADRVDLARVPKGRVADLAAWQIFAGSPSAPAWVPWANRATRKPVLSDPGRVNRPHASHLGGCWTMAVTMPPASGTRGGGGLAVYTSAHPYGPWNRRYYAAGVDLGESAQFSPLFPGTLLLTQGRPLRVAAVLPAGRLLSRAAPVVPSPAATPSGSWRAGPGPAPCWSARSSSPYG